MELESSPKFITDLSQDPYNNRFVLGICGRVGGGKTSVVLDLAKANNLVYLISTDQGTAKARQEYAANPTVYGGRLGIKYAENLATAKAAMRLVKEEVDDKLKKGIPPDKIWVVLDTVNSLQGNLLFEATEYEVINADLDKNKPKPKKEDREFLCEIDWGVNFRLMTGLFKVLLSCPVNIVMTVLHTDKQYKGRALHVPAIQGSYYSKWMGDVEVLLYLYVDPNGDRVFKTRPTMAWEAKDRFGKLDEDEPCYLTDESNKVPALVRIRNKIFKKG